MMDQLHGDNLSMDNHKAFAHMHFTLFPPADPNVISRLTIEQRMALGRRRQRALSRIKKTVTFNTSQNDVVLYEEKDKVTNSLKN